MRETDRTEGPNERQKDSSGRQKRGDKEKPWDYGVIRENKRGKKLCCKKEKEKR